MFYKLFSSTILLVALSSHAFAQTAAPAPSVDKLREHVAYLASEKLEGRRTGTNGVEAAAKYIASEYERLGLRAPKDKGFKSYLQPFPFVAGVTLGKGNSLSFSKSELRVGEDWMPLGFSLNSRIGDVPAVFVAYGITAADLNYDDYSRASAAGKVAIAFAAAPDEDNPHGRFSRYKDPRWRAVAARNAGAKALFLIVRAANFKEAHLSRLHFDNSAGDAGISVIAISRQAAIKLLALPNDAALTELESNIKRNTTTPIAPGQGTPADQVKAASAITLSTNVVRQKVPAHNVVGIIEGSDAVLKNEAIVIGAHYDHLGRGGEGSLAPKEGDVHHGADDNASGTAGLLELARIFSAQKPRRTIVFAAFSGEEEGLLGSNFYVNNPSIPLANTIAMINMDMIGRMKDNKLVIGGVGTAPEWRPIIETANLLQSVTVSATGTPASTRNYPLVVASNGRAIVTSDSTKQFVITMNEDGFGPSDHSSFYAKQIPVLFFWTGTHDDYHKPSDTADKINYADHARIVAVVAKIIREVDSADKRPTYAVTKSPATGRSTGFRVYLGTIPNYSDSNDGLLLDGVREDSPASKAGLQVGDRIVKLAGRDVRNVYDYTHALSEMKADTEYEVEVMRGTTRLTLKITPAARK
ncbi:MAG TPA: M20/M25/M40 family metallo-hydrolase [Pyrinomonadaceae bacterium]|nr:M20/M25/M40 family metallo-hydrolase [Pyrinomonadaceae bacterium]